MPANGADPRVGTRRARGGKMRGAELVVRASALGGAHLHDLADLRASPAQNSRSTARPVEPASEMAPSFSSKVRGEAVLPT